MQAEALRRHETNELSVSLDEARRELREVHQSNHHHRLLAEARHDEILALGTSLSWRITWPMRLAFEFSLSLMKAFLDVTKRAFRPLIILVMNFLLSRPNLRKKIVSVTSKFPLFNSFHIRFAENSGLVEYSVLQEQPAVHQQSKTGKYSQRKITNIDYFDLMLLDKVSDTYGGLEIDFNVIKCIRKTKVLSYPPYAKNIATGVIYAYLSLLTRYPSAQEIQHHKKTVEKFESFDALFHAILTSPEFRTRGYRRVEG